MIKEEFKLITKIKMASRIGSAREGKGRLLKIELDSTMCFALVSWQQSDFASSVQSVQVP